MFVICSKRKIAYYGSNPQANWTSWLPFSSTFFQRFADNVVETTGVCAWQLAVGQELWYWEFKDACKKGHFGSKVQLQPFKLRWNSRKVFQFQFKIRSFFQKWILIFPFLNFFLLPGPPKLLWFHVQAGQTASSPGSAYDGEDTLSGGKDQIFVSFFLIVKCEIIYNVL